MVPIKEAQFMTKRIISLILILVFIFAITANASIYEEKTVTTLTKGVTLTHLKQFTVNGWQNINVIEADLNEEYITLDVLTPKDGIDSLENVKAMAQNNNTVAAINSDFFSWSGSTGKQGSSIGTLIKNSKLLSSAYETNDTCATLSITDKNSVFIDFVTTDITVTAPSGESAKIKHLNKYDSLEQICIYTSDFKKITPGSMNNILEMVIEDGVVTEMRREMEGVEVPEDGYVIRHLPEYDPFLTDNFQVGDKIEIDIKTSLDLSKIKSAVGGGTKLVENGKPAKITHNISGVNPRTAAGTDQTGNIVYLVTVDGRQSNAKGMTLEQLTEFLINYGIYNAINFDGGGSTTMVAKKDGIQTVINAPSQQSLRAVANGLGIYSLAPKGAFSSFDINIDESVMLSGTSKEFSIGSCYDDYHNVIDVDKASVIWSVDDEYGYFENNIFYATKPAENIEISAQIGNVTEKSYITVYGPPARISVTPSHFNKKDITESDFSVTGYDEKGYKAKIHPKDIKVANVSNTETGSKKITVNNATCFISYSNENTQNFEQKNFSHRVYPAEYTSGSAEITSYLSKSKNNSAKLSFDFTNNETVTKASYLVFDSPIKINERKYAGVWLYSPGPMLHTVKAQLRTADNELITVTLCDKINFSGWKYLSTIIPENAETLNSLYIVQNNTNEKTKGFVLFDDLSLYNSGNIDFAELKDDYVPSDKPKTDDMTFLVTGKIATGNTLLTKVLNSKIKSALQNESAFKCFSLDNVTFDGLDVITIDGYSSFNEKGNLFINLNNSDGYLSKAQFEKFAKDIRSQNYKNLFVFMNEDFSFMSDSTELSVLKSLLAEASKTKSVFAFFSSDCDNMYKEDNVNYIGVKGVNISSAYNVSERKDTFTYIKTVITDSGVKINFENFIE